MPSVPAVPTVQCPLLPVKTLVEAEERRLLAQLLGVALVAVLEHQTRPRHAPVTDHAKLGRSCFYQLQHCNCITISVFCQSGPDNRLARHQLGEGLTLEFSQSCAD